MFAYSRRAGVPLSIYALEEEVKSGDYLIERDLAHGCPPTTRVPPVLAR
jgi:hypothetical protein